MLHWDVQNVIKIALGDSSFNYSTRKAFLDKLTYIFLKNTLSSANVCKKNKTKQKHVVYDSVLEMPNKYNGEKKMKSDHPKARGFAWLSGERLYWCLSCAPFIHWTRNLRVIDVTNR